MFYRSPTESLIFLCQVRVLEEELRMARADAWQHPLEMMVNREFVDPVGPYHPSTNGVLCITMYNPYKCPKINGFHWGYFTPIQRRYGALLIIIAGFFGPKPNCLPLKIGRGPKGSRIVSLRHHFSKVFAVSGTVDILLMEEIPNNHLGWLKPYN